ncbi:hypothetical protein DSO57_1029329 [Entomophthora muscae]|uniref:Uncharacterized protein n=1 Tax=Entomophthora muscae TaxID=34485 RepID=A0ACC2T246_9FUNG|nr:hypothetical protein DSO57_1029329 [Entomophthora muscae]
MAMCGMGLSCWILGQPCDIGLLPFLACQTAYWIGTKPGDDWMLTVSAATRISVHQAPQHWEGMTLLVQVRLYHLWAKPATVPAPASSSRPGKGAWFPDRVARCDKNFQYIENSIIQIDMI